MGLFGSDSGSLFRRRSKGLSEVQDELVKKYPVVILTRTPSKPPEDFMRNNWRRKSPYGSCEKWIEKNYEMQRFSRRNSCSLWSKIGIVYCDLEVYPEKLLNDKTGTS